MSEPLRRGEAGEAWAEAVREAAPPPLWGFFLAARVDIGETVRVAVDSEVAIAIANAKGVPERLREALGRRIGPLGPIELVLAGEPGSLTPPPPLPPPAPVATPQRSTDAPQTLFHMGRPLRGKPEPLASVEAGEALVEGTVFRVSERQLKGGGTLVLLDVSDGTDALRVKLFLRQGVVLPSIPRGARLRARGDVQYDRLEHQDVLVARDVDLDLPPLPDPGPPRWEVHLHTTMSAMDGLLQPDALMQAAHRHGVDGVVITDHGVVQAYPDAWRAARAHGVRLRYGIEAYVVDEEPIVLGPAPTALGRFVALDFETTGLSPRTGQVIEIGAVRFVDGEPEASFASLVRPAGEVPDNVLELTGITARELADAPSLGELLAPFLDFLGDLPLVAHNAAFDRGFLRVLAQEGGRRLTNPVLDTLALGRRLHPDLRNHRLPELASALGVPMGEHHRARDDAETAGRLLAAWLRQGALRPPFRTAGSWSPALGRPFHALGIVTSREGLRELYRLVSQSHLEGFHRVPRLERRLIARPGLIWGAPACPDGELVAAWLRGDDPGELAALAARYDFVEIPLPSRLLASLDPGFGLDRGAAEAMVRDLAEAARAAGVPALYGSDAHHLTPEEGILRRIAGRAQGLAAQPTLPLPSTRAVLDELEPLLPDARAIVLENPARLLDPIPEFPPVPEGLHAPDIPEAEVRVREDSLARARALYPEPWPEVVAERLQRELAAILDHGYAVVYHVARLLVETSRADGYLVGSRGSVGSSFVAFLLGITEVNPLPPHYLCPGCYVEFRNDVADGFDLPRRSCPRCGRPLQGDGHDIPFETFLGFEGDKVPDIDLNFSGEEQPRIHRRAEEIFGRERVFRAGTIATVAERTAYGLVKGYLKDEGRNVRDLEVERLALGLVGVKRTTGQHPGGVMIVPQDLDVHDFTPVQHPADDPSAETVTTHFDYSAISSRLLKLDLLGHDDPTILRLLAEMTGEDPETVPLDDPATLSLFHGLAALGIPPAAAGGDVGTLGIPEFGTRFVRGMLEATRPRTFSELVRISGLSHGTDVWTNNARDLIREGVASLSEVIATRDDIMLYLVAKGVDKKHAFKIMEQVRKGKGLTAEDVEAMRAAGVPEWYIASCQKILYMFPKAHAAAYVTNAVRIAYFKVHHPAAFYASYFSVRAEEFDLTHASMGEQELAALQRQLQEKGREGTQRERALATHLEVAREMRARGLRFLPLSLEHSDPFRYWPEPEGIRPPFAAIPGLGRTGATLLAEARREAPFRSQADLRARGRVPRPVLETMERLGALEGLSPTDQMTLF